MSAVPPPRPFSSRAARRASARPPPRRLAAAGWTVYATARRPETLAALEAKGCRTLALDVTDEDSMRAAVEAVEEARGRRRRARQQRRLQPVGRRGVGHRWTPPAASSRPTSSACSACASSCCPACARSAGAASSTSRSMGGRLTLPRRRALPREQARGRGAVGRAALRGPPVRRRRRGRRAGPHPHRASARRWPARIDDGHRRRRALRRLQPGRRRGHGERVRGAARWAGWAARRTPSPSASRPSCAIRSRAPAIP